MIASLLLCLALSKGVTNDPLEIAVTTTDLADLVQQIGGNNIKVVSLVPKNAIDPHKIIPKGSMLIKLKRADALVSMGLGFEHAYLPALLEKVGRFDELGNGATGVSTGGSRHLVASQFIGAPLEIPETLNRGQGHIHPLGNPHWNTDPRLMQKAAGGIRDFFKQLRPESAESFQENWSKWDKKITKNIGHWESWLKPLRGKSLVTYHRSWSYFAKNFGLGLLGEIEPKPGMPPTTRHLGNLAKSMLENNARVILMEPWYNESKLGNLPKLTQVKVLKIESLSGTKGYLAWMNKVVTEIASAWNLTEPEFK